MRELDAREEWVADLAADYRAASEEARADYEPRDTYEPDCEDDGAATSWPPTAETGLQLVRTPAPPAGMHGDRGDADVARAAGPSDRHDGRLPVCGTCDGSGTLPSGAKYGGSIEYVGCPECDRDQDPEPACLIHDTSGEEVRGWRHLADVRAARIARVRALHYAADNDAARTPICETCHGKAGVHECGCWAERDREPVCGHCMDGWHGASVPWPCPTIRALDSDGLDPDPACLIHDTAGEDVRGWEMAECTCTKGVRP